MHECANNQAQIECSGGWKIILSNFLFSTSSYAVLFFAVKKGIQYKSFKSSIGPRHHISEIVDDLSCLKLAAGLKRLETRMIESHILFQ